MYVDNSAKNLLIAGSKRLPGILTLESCKAERMDELRTACRRDTTEISSTGKGETGRQYILCRRKALIAKLDPFQSGRKTYIQVPDKQNRRSDKRPDRVHGSKAR